MEATTTSAKSVLGPEPSISIKNADTININKKMEGIGTGNIEITEKDPKKEGITRRGGIESRNIGRRRRIPTSMKEGKSIKSDFTTERRPMPWKTNSKRG